MVCKDKASKRRKVAEKGRQQAAKVVAENPDVEMHRQGSVFRDGKAEGYWHDVDQGAKSITNVSVILGVTVAAASRAYQAWLAESAAEALKDEWVMSWRGRAQIAVTEMDELRELGIDAEGTEPYEKLMDRICRKFWIFEHRHFTIGSRNKKFVRKPFHEQALREMVVAFVFAVRVLILTPPRHGKSEIVLRFDAWLIVQYPDIQILWVASNSKVAIIMTRKLKGVLRYTETLRLDFLPPRGKFLDDYAPKFTEDEFITYTRTNHTLKSATFTALGSTATVAGRDADWIGVDDLEELKTVGTKEMRQKSKEKHNEIMERQEDHTGVVTIGSRQHIDDIPSALLDEDDEELKWRVSVFPAHDENACESDPDNYKLHVDCMLMPEIRSYKWLMRQEKETAALGLPGRHQLRYQQKAVPIEGIIFDIPLIKEKCLDKSRGLGMDGLPPMRLIAGLDPAARGVQAAFCWGWDGQTLHMIDLEVGSTKSGKAAGGVLGAVRVMELWDDKWDLKDWFHEDNSGQIDAWNEAGVFRKAILERHLNIKPHTTGKNKHDPESGISSMASWYHQGKISLPYGTPDARRKVKMLLDQLELWTTDGLSRRGKTDIKMAHWFPFPRIQKWDRNERRPKLVLTSDQSYPDLGGNSAPWGVSGYIDGR